MMLGVIFPGEIAILVAGADAQTGALPLPAVLVAGITGAIAGDVVGFALGRRYGDRMVARLPARLVKPEGVQTTRDLLRRYGAVAVVIGRFTALFRALVPGLAGMSGLRWRTFVPYNVLGGTVWASGVALLGYLAGASLGAVESKLSLVSEIVLVAVAVAAVAVYLGVRARRRSSKV